VGLKHFGIYKDADERAKNYPLFVEKKGIKIAFLNYTYGTNEIVEVPPNIVNRIDTILIAADIEKALQESPDFIIAVMHWGNEYENVQNSQQKKLAGFLARKGVNLIIGSHPHVVQPFDKIFAPGISDTVPVIYSLGNFVSNQRDRYRNGGVVFEAVLEKAENKTRVVSTGYLPFWVYRPQRSDGFIYRLLPECPKKEGSPCEEYQMSKEDKAAMGLFFSDTKKTLKNLRQILWE
jgi:poly-gamma-glutamate synthesis protein (capsule biosynthesis protein)